MQEEEDYDALFWEHVEKCVPVVDADSTAPIVVVGAGVIGLTSALFLRRAFPRAPLTVVSSDFGLPTSAVSAGVWFPFMASDARVGRFAETTYGLLSDWVAEVGRRTGRRQCLTAMAREGRRAGRNPVVAAEAWTLSDDEKESFACLPPYVARRALGKEELRHESWAAGREWTTLVVQSQLQLPLLRRLLARRGARMRKEKVEKPAEFGARQGKGATVVNCAGLGAGEMIGDKEVYPVQGSIVKIAPLPQLTQGRFLDWISAKDAREYAYIIPRADCYILGGTGHPHVWSREPPSDETVRGIVERCDRLAPGLASQARELRRQTDLRPVRATLALGPNEKHEGWVDAYVFGGSGWTVHIGAALEVVEQVKQMRARERKAKM